MRRGGLPGDRAGSVGPAQPAGRRVLAHRPPRRAGPPGLLANLSSRAPRARAGRRLNGAAETANCNMNTSSWTRVHKMVHIPVHKCDRVTAPSYMNILYMYSYKYS